ncbi:Holliday junction resolvase RuvX [Paenibacillus hodogayensis]|uniref:Putative pre-16S rRNA nuclease n=1 Tax=Paenibacillus hodogayensis TaxID=279208 RepID=A0ABV5VVD2_9BACL
MGRIMGLDYGDKTIGVAISDAFGWTAQGVEVVRRRRPEDDMARLRQLVGENEVTDIVLGLPKNMNNTIGPRGEMCLAFAESLREALELPVVMWDERLSTAAAQRTLLEADVSRKKRKQVVDKMAAAIILQNYLDSKSNR